MHTATIHIKSQSLYSQSRPHNEPKRPKEAAGDWEARTWVNRVHSDNEGVVIPGMAFQNCLAEAAKFLSIQIPGKGKSTYTKHFEAGLIVPDAVRLFHPGTDQRVLPPSEQEAIASRLKNNPDVHLTKEEKKSFEGWKRQPHEVWGDWIFTPSDGVAGSGKRVWRCYPIINAWEGDLNVMILDDTITEEVFRRVLSQAGQLIGVGRFRVRNRGNYGRFTISENLNWKKMDMD